MSLNIFGVEGLERVLTPFGSRSKIKMKASILKPSIKTSSDAKKFLEQVKNLVSMNKELLNDLVKEKSSVEADIFIEVDTEGFSKKELKEYNQKKNKHARWKKKSLSTIERMRKYTEKENDVLKKKHGQLFIDLYNYYIEKEENDRKYKI